MIQREMKQGKGDWEWDSIYKGEGKMKMKEKDTWILEKGTLGRQKIRCQLQKGACWVCSKECQGREQYRGGNHRERMVNDEIGGLGPRI